MKKLSGGCLCGAVRFEVSGEVKSVVNCHCTLCRKMNGAAFSTYAAVLDDHFELLQGEVNQHQVTDQATKTFCPRCGTPIFNMNPKYAGLKILHFGVLDSPEDLLPAVNVYCSSKLDWVDQLLDIPGRPDGLS
jgi:hypothetical protein